MNEENQEETRVPPLKPWERSALVNGLPLAEESDEMGEYAAAMAAFQAECPAIPKRGFNPHFRSHYALLEDILSATAPTRGKFGLAFSQRANVREVGGKFILYIVTTVRHKSGQWERAYSVWPSGSKNDPQAIRAGLTYARSGEAMTILGVAGGEEDDGEAQAGRPSKDQSPPVKTPPKKPAPKAPPKAEKKAQEAVRVDPPPKPSSEPPLPEPPEEMEELFDDSAVATPPQLERMKLLRRATRTSGTAAKELCVRLDITASSMAEMLAGDATRFIKALEETLEAIISAAPAQADIVRGNLGGLTMREVLG